jgi:hypothetical protein
MSAAVGRMRVIALGVVCMVLFLPMESPAQRTGGTDADCAVCHGELELLRQNVPRLSRARELLVVPADIVGSAHDGMACAECHTGFASFPHSREAATETCRSCHGDAERDWMAGRHAEITAEGEPAASCSTCHDIHRVDPVQELATGPAMLRINERCSDCHQTYTLPAGDPHAGEVGCWTCHAPHAVHAKDDPRAFISPLAQSQTCGACHEEAVAAWRTDIHGRAVLSALTTGGVPASLPVPREVPVCSGCHGGHGIVAVEDPAFTQESTNRCSECHERAAETFYGSYHGRATALGSRVSAACHTCHGSHRVFPDDDPRSTVHEANLIETCGQCHEHARPRFVQYDNHPDPFDRSRNPGIFYAFWFMNGMLASVLGVFGIHTVLWWIRLWIDRRRGVGHGHHHHHAGGAHAPEQHDEERGR